MNPKAGSTWLLAALAVLVTVAAACGSTSTPSATSKGTITVAGFNFPESSILAELYGQELAHGGYTVNYKLLLGTREVISPAIQSGQIDLYPGYAATDLEFYNKGAGEASGDPVATTAKLNTHLQPLGLVALDPSAAVDQNAFAVTKATQSKYNLTKLSDLAPIGNQLVLGAGPECPTRPFCQPGLEKTYGIHFKAFTPLDTDGPLTRAAFKNGSIQVGLVFSSDADLGQLGLVVLQDDKQLENADNVVPILRQAVASSDVKTLLNSIDSKLTTADLVTMNSQVELLHQDADAVARAYLQQHNYFS
ncbi:MAG TPA: ABC transporter substrate-binding protein [Candidatus Dormibacteraeota bacterium]|jgi:osmoprotectant transport system substrate-binding protein